MNSLLRLQSFPVRIRLICAKNRQKALKYWRESKSKAVSTEKFPVFFPVNGNLDGEGFAADSNHRHRVKWFIINTLSLLDSPTFRAISAQILHQRISLRVVNLPLSRPSAGKPYEIAFVDWQMPGMDGIETGNRIRALPDLPAPPHLVMVTAYGREEVLKQAENNAFRSVLIKPVTASMLFDSAIQILGEHQDQAEALQASPNALCRVRNASSESPSLRLTRGRNQAIGA